MRTNGTFEYKPVGSVQTDPKTGFAIPNDKAPFLQGCECQIDKSIPARQVVGTDGQIYAYTYDVFIPKYFDGVFGYWLYGACYKRRWRYRRVCCFGC